MISTTFHADHATILMAEPFRIDTVRGVIQEVDLACYYRYEIIELELDSPGGESSAFHILARHLASARAGRSFRLVTRAMGLCASAAALTLSLGDLGYRQAHPFSKLLYHFSRVAPGLPLTAESTSTLGDELAREDLRLVNLLARHILGREVEARHFRAAGLGYPEPAGIRGGRPISSSNAGTRLQSITEKIPRRSLTGGRDLIGAYLSLMKRDTIVGADRAKELRLIDQIL